MKASPEIWKTLNAWIAFYFFVMILVGVLTYNGSLVIFG